MPAKVYTDKDANLAVLKNKTLAVLGFGSYKAMPTPLQPQKSGLNVIIGLYEGSKSIAAAERKRVQGLSDCRSRAPRRRDLRRDS